jgi:hypothetical protein
VSLLKGSDLDLALDRMEEISIFGAKRLEVTPERASELHAILRTPEMIARVTTMLLDGTGAAHLVRSVRAAVERNSTVFDGKWGLFAGPDVVLARSYRRVPERDRVWELYIAAACLKLDSSADVRVANNDNPDIQCVVRGTLWGIECKAFGSLDTARHVSNLEKALRQIEDSSVERGLVAVNLTAALDHSRYHASLGAFGTQMFTPDELVADLRDQVLNVTHRILETGFRNTARSFPKTRGLFFQGQTIALAGKALTPTTFRHWLSLGERDGADLKMERRFESAVRGQ